LLPLMSWELWNEHKVGIFRRRFSSTLSLIAKIKDQARMLCIAGAKHLRQIIPEE
ncbi:hypothetical protein BAE44_0005458, partial [Dichanthelium oligosanthes]